ncbi:DUF547 domain-containing protein [Psychroserpens sp. Hel_I_66]|uniref:DUF547 domain-containing protein n=1 Tax=Psychroserpens sp. Hel_I_66 TaxID=1250004 RepID=UPI000AF77E61|nr:DUF547 domain-containing protein [Psychroserpens sp. Hel_I_66]
MKYSKHIITTLLLVFLYGCFSAKGLPIKEVKDEPATEKTTSETSMNENDNGDDDLDSETVEEDVQTDSVTMDNPLLDHSSWDQLLKKYVADNGDVDYKGFKNDSQKLNEYVNYLASQVPEKSWTVDEQLAYFINVYNANTIKLIIDNYPLKSIKDISNPWLKNRLKIGDEDYSLADIENGILRKMNEPKIHFAINCASISCPKLMNTAYTAENVQDLMKQATEEFINNSEKNKLSINSPKISEIFKWYKSDFTENGTIINYINKYANTKISEGAKINYIEYNWGLNDQK